jgi:hypothetical protein
LRNYLIAFLSLVLSSAALAACGGGGSSSGTTHTTTTSQVNEFATSFRTATAPFQNLSKEIGTAIERASHLTDEELAQEFKGLSTHWQETVSAVEALHPPASLAVGYNTVKDGVSRVESDLNSVVTASETHSKNAGEQAGASLVTDILSAKSAAEQLEKEMSGSAGNGSTGNS